MIMDGGNKTKVVTEVGVGVRVETAADFWVSSQRHRSQQVVQGKLRIPPVTSASAYPVYSFSDHHLPAT